MTEHLPTCDVRGENWICAPGCPAGAPGAQAWDDPAGRIRELETELHQMREASMISVEWGVLGEAFSPQPSREAAERTVKRLTTGKYRVANRRVAYRLVTEPRVFEGDQ